MPSPMHNPLADPAAASSAEAGPAEAGPAVHPGLGMLSPYPFPRLRALLGDGPPGKPPIDLSIGEPKHAVPPLAVETLAAHAADWNRYPPPRGTPELRAACANWLGRRFALEGALVDPERAVLPLSGTKEGLFACGLLLGGGTDGTGQPGRPDRPLAAMPDPLYPVYEGAARFGGLEPVFLAPPDMQSGVFSPDSLDPALLDRLTLLFLCNPSNPQGGVLGPEGLARLVDLARRHGFVLVSDECYADIYRDAPPPSVLQVAGGSLENLLVFHSLSKRSNAAGLRGGFVAGDPRLIDAMANMRNYAAAGMPLPVQAAAAALWDDDAHAAENRALYNQKFAAIGQVLSGRIAHRVPPAGFFLWLDLAGSRFADGEEAALTLWREQGLKLLPGAYLAQGGAGRASPSAAFIRLAIVQDRPLIEQAMERLAEGLAP